MNIKEITYTEQMGHKKSTKRLIHRRIITQIRLINLSTEMWCLKHTVQLTTQNSN